MRIFTPTLLVLLAISFPLSARAQDLEIDPGDSQITIRGFTGDDKSFNGDVRVTLRNATQANSPKLLLLPSHLQRSDGEQINRQQVQVGDAITLTPDVPTTVPIKVTGVKAPGEYKGKLELLLTGQPRNAAKSVEVTVVARVRATLTALANADLKTNLVNCDVACWLVTWILPGSTDENYEIKFEKPIGAAQPVLEIATDVKGEKNGFQWNANHFKFGPPPTSPQANGQTNSAGATEKRFQVFTVTLSDLPADHYIGSIYLSLDADTPLIKLPVDVNVRADPFWPLLFLIVGVLLGKLIKYMQDKGEPAADALTVLNRLEARLQQAEQMDQGILAEQVASARRLINQNQPADATAAIKSIDGRLTTLNDLRAIEARLAGKEDHETVKEVLKQIAQVRELIWQQNDVAITPVMDAIEKNLVNLSTTLMGDEHEPNADVANAAEVAKRAAASSSVPKTKVALQGNKVRRFLANFSGVVDDLRAETALWILRPLLWLVLILGLIALGLKSLYIDNPTFGANAADYVSLIFWGMSSDVASRALGSLKFG